MAHSIDLGIASIELDVNETSDGVLVGTHDATPASGAWISDVTFAQLASQDRENWDGRRLENIMAFALPQSVMMYFDLKSITPEGLRKIASSWPAETASGQLTYASARGDVVAWLGEELSGAATSFLYYDRLLDLRSVEAFMSPTFVHPCFDHLRDPLRSVDEGYVARARGLGFSLVSWSENDPDRIARLAALGFDYICTDESAVAIEAVASQAVEIS